MNQKGINEMKKVLLFGLNGRGGMLQYTSQFANALAKDRNVSVVIPSYTDSRVFNKEIKIIMVYAPPNIKGTVMSCIMFWKHLWLVYKIKKGKYDIIHYMDNHPFYIPYDLLINKNIRRVVTQHDPKLHEGEVNKITKEVNDYLRFVADKIIVHGEKLKEYLVSEGISSDKIMVSKMGLLIPFKEVKEWKEPDWDNVADIMIKNYRDAIS